jgi:hypothetical protein
MNLHVELNKTVHSDRNGYGLDNKDLDHGKQETMRILVPIKTTYPNMRESRII